MKSVLVCAETKGLCLAGTFSYPGRNIISMNRDSDAELDSFITHEADAADPKKHKSTGTRKGDDKDLPKLFMQLSWSEQRKAGTKAPVLRQVEGDSISQRLRNYRRSIFFHLHGSNSSLFKPRASLIQSVTGTAIQPSWITMGIFTTNCE